MSLPLAAATAIANAQSLRWTNPLVEHRADLRVFLHDDGCFYLPATAPEYDHIEVRRARTIDGLSRAQARTIWTKHAEGEMGAHLWAPELHWIEGSWHVHFTATPAEHVWDIRLYVLECEDKNPLTGKWQERSKLTVSR